MCVIYVSVVTALQCYSTSLYTLCRYGVVYDYTVVLYTVSWSVFGIGIIGYNVIIGPCPWYISRLVLAPRSL